MSASLGLGGLVVFFWVPRPEVLSFDILQGYIGAAEALPDRRGTFQV